MVMKWDPPKGADMKNPPHYKDRKTPCSWCGAKWENTESRVAEMHHQPLCTYIRVSTKLFQN